ncbi:hypothetical protein K469DRAFT_632535 [Zopfia rhizophila CBS 207.26]|uniref:RTA1 domain protein n=1 Tax=Zopfia rhizophila CBS 207.26 TaxID=1314779 RepID=A0A6A6E569_9PEZI|nr:hypothetical protein K469DRAFT_632535 [Zopfia rhizophila CBS 207.26]
MAADAVVTTYYPYKPNHVLPAIFAAIVGASFLVHIWQNFRYRFWRVTFFMFWGGAIFTTGWVLRCISSYHPTHKNLYIAQTVFVLGGPPIYSAAEYNILGRLMHYLPMHAPLNPGRVVYFFIYLGALVESLTAAGAVLMTGARNNKAIFETGGTLLSISIVLQAVVECLFMVMVALLHYRCLRAGMMSRKVHTICIMLYGTSALILLRCIFRAVEKFSEQRLLETHTCDTICEAVVKHEWYIYAFEATPMVLYTYWLNIVHPGKYLPHKTNIFLDFNGIERIGPGWIDKRSTWQTFADPFDLAGVLKGRPAHEKFWLRPDDWPTSVKIGYNHGTATNVSTRYKLVNQSEADM